MTNPKKLGNVHALCPNRHHRHRLAPVQGEAIHGHGHAANLVPEVVRPVAVVATVAAVVAVVHDTVVAEPVVRDPARNHRRIHGLPVKRPPAPTARHRRHRAHIVHVLVRAVNLVRKVDRPVVVVVAVAHDTVAVARAAEAEVEPNNDDATTRKIAKKQKFNISIQSIFVVEFILMYSRL